MQYLSNSCFCLGSVNISSQTIFCVLGGEIIMKNRIKSIRNRIKDESGVVPIVEATIVFPVMFFILFFIIFIGNMYFTLQCLDENKRVVDEAYFATANMPQAMEDYRSRDAYIKRFGLVQDGRFVPLLSSEGGTYDEE